jgi:cellulose synthase (UDP-forming)
VAYVQAPQVYYNQRASFIARGAAEETYAYYSSHLMASYGLGHTIVIGSHTVHRVRALESVGGFPAHDAEDLYLTMVYRASEWRGVYVPEILAMGLAPVDWRAYLRQQVRWSRAVLDLKRHAFTKLAGSLSPLEKALNLFHGTYYLRPLLLLAFFVVAVAMVVQNDPVSFLEWRPITALLALAVLLGVIDRFRARFFLDPKRESGLTWRAQLLQIAKAPHLAVAVIDVLRDRRVEYVTTTKLATGRAPLTLAPPHLALAAIMAVALGVGYALGGPIQPSLLVLALGVIGVSFALAWTEAWTFPPPFDPTLLPRRRREMADLLPPAPAAPPAENEPSTHGIR